MSIQTPNYNLEKPDVGGDTDTWGGLLNGNADIIDAEMKKAVKNDGSEEANESPVLRLGGFVFSLSGPPPADPADPETRDLIIGVNGLVVFRLSPEVDTHTPGDPANGLRVLDITADDPV